MLLENKIAIVTGASRGIGKEIAKTLAREGASVVINFAHSKDKAQEVVDEISLLGGRAALCHADISDEEQAKGLIDYCCELFGTPDILVNNAGVTKDNILINMSTEDWDYVMNNNLKGTFLCSKFAIRKMLRKRYGKIVNVTSISGLMGNAGQCNYSASKAGIIGLTKTIAQEYGMKGITANAISPGIIDTEMSRQVNQETQEFKVQETILRRPGTPKEIASVALFLSSSLSDYVNGSVIRADGGIRF